MKPPELKKPRENHKPHYSLEITFEVPADSLELAIKRCGNLFRKAYRAKLKEGMVYMGAYSARVRGSLHAKRTMHPTVVVPSLVKKPGVTLQELDAEEAARNAAREARKVKRAGVTAPPVAPSPSTSDRVLVPVHAAAAPAKKASMKGLFR